MQFSKPTLPLLLQLLAASTALSQSAVSGIDPRNIVDRAESLLVDTYGFNSNGFATGVTPCSNYFGFAAGGPDQGEQTSAQWVRSVFHDFVTADVAAGTGGLDSSIGFESNRPENAGLFINDTLTFGVPTTTAYLSASDNVAVGLVLAVADCGGRASEIALRVGRIDAQEPGPSGVPEPTTDIETTLAQFAKAGFSQADTIAVTACGHSLGHVHYSNFPTIVDNSTVSPTNLDGGVDIDTTPGVWDPTVVNEYLHGTGLKGGPLVTTFNKTSNSDFRLYSSDNNATMKTITTTASFQSKCSSLFTRMLDTVPSFVQLSEVVTPQAWKGVNIILDLTPTGVVTISGLIRHMDSAGYAPATVPYTTGNGILTTGAVAGTGNGSYGTTTWWEFNSTITTPGTSSLNFAGVSYPVNDEIFILPVQSTVTSTREFVIKAAVLTSHISTTSTMSGLLYVPTFRLATVAPEVVETPLNMTKYGTAGKYTLFSGAITTRTPFGIIASVSVGKLTSLTVESALFTIPT